MFYLQTFQKKRLPKLLNFTEMSLRSSLWEGFYKIAIMHLFPEPLKNVFEKVCF